MKVELQCGDTIAIPEGCKAIVKDGSVVFEKEEKAEVQEFKDGDVLCSIYNDTMVIFKDVNKNARDYFDSHYNNKDFSDKLWYSASFRHATEEEKSEFFDKMKEQGLRWNAEEKRVENIRWRAKRHETYYSVHMCLSMVNTIETYKSFDNKLWDNFNYFRTKEQAEEAVKRVRETLRKYHEEIGE